MIFSLPFWIMLLAQNCGETTIGTGSDGADQVALTIGSARTIGYDAA
jgi:hypothetical protein